MKKFATFVLKAINYNEILYQKVNIDQLTGLFNRNHYSQIIENLTLSPSETLGVIFFDFDNLKEINDSYGHSIGDRQLKTLSHAIKKIYHDCDICRIGGDEFVVIMCNHTYEDYNERNYKFNDEMERLSISCSFGLCYRSSHVNILEMIQIAENDMYYYKRKHHAEKRSSMSHSFFIHLQKDIKNGKFFLVLQPKMNPYNGTLVGAEVLARGKGKNQQWVSPNDFVPAFEKNQCIDLLDYFMIEQTCILQLKLLKEYKKEIPLSVNISHYTLLLTTFCKDMIALFAKYDIPYHLIHFEITEKVDVDVKEISTCCREMHDIGFVFEIDNFGSFFTNVSFLDSNIFSFLKMDCSLIKQICTNELTKDMMSFLINKCHENNISIIAKSVETKEQLDHSCMLNVDIIQGFYYDKPLTIEAFLKKYPVESFDKILD